MHYNAILSKMVYAGDYIPWEGAKMIKKGEPNLRMREIYKLRTIGNLSFREIGEEFDISGSRARQIYKKGIAIATGDQNDN
jgi:hypothetical protein|tara:strand:+ start:341 stop:583 length:243 start_codon:yes stop_codon:yes gene_type:complete